MVPMSPNWDFAVVEGLRWRPLLERPQTFLIRLSTSALPSRHTQSGQAASRPTPVIRQCSAERPRRVVSGRPLSFRDRLCKATCRKHRAARLARADLRLAVVTPYAPAEARLLPSTAARRAQWRTGSPRCRILAVRRRPARCPPARLRSLAPEAPSPPRWCSRSVHACDHMSARS